MPQRQRSGSSTTLGSAFPMRSNLVETNDDQFARVDFPGAVTAGSGIHAIGIRGGFDIFADAPAPQYCD